MFMPVCRSAADSSEERAGHCEASTLQLQQRLAVAQAELEDSRGCVAQIVDSHAAELAARAHVAAHQQTALANERAANARLLAQVQDLKGSLASSELSRCVVHTCVPMDHLSGTLVPMDHLSGTLVPALI